jgi:hypothetical protein
MIVDRFRVSVVLTCGLGLLVAAFVISHNRADPMPLPASDAGLRAWQQSCPTAINGLCLVHRPARAKAERPYQCGPETAGSLVVVPRNLPPTARAQLEASKSVEAKLALIDIDLESFLAIDFPKDLRFDGPDTAKSQQQLALWLETQHHRASLLRARYEAIVDPVGSVRAAERIARAARHTVDVLMSAPIPVQDEDAIDAYCDALTAVAEPLDVAVTEAYEHCVVLARQNAYVGNAKPVVERARPCLAELAMQRPQDSPLAGEHLGNIDEQAKLQIEIGNYALAAGLLGTTSTYDSENARGVILHGLGNDIAAEATYRRAIVIDSSRNEAYFNLGLLLEKRAEKAEVDDAKEIYLDALVSFEFADAPDEAAMVRKAIAQIKAFQAGRH